MNCHEITPAAKKQKIKMKAEPKAQAADMHAPNFLELQPKSYAIPTNTFNCEKYGQFWAEDYEMSENYLIPLIFELVRPKINKKGNSYSLSIVYNSAHIGDDDCNFVAALNHSIKTHLGDMPLNKFEWNWRIVPVTKNNGIIGPLGLPKDGIFLRDNVLGISNKLELELGHIKLVTAIAANQKMAINHLIFAMNLVEKGGTVIIGIPPVISQELAKFLYIFSTSFSATLLTHAEIRRHIFIVGQGFLRIPGNSLDFLSGGSPDISMPQEFAQKLPAGCAEIKQKWDNKPIFPIPRPISSNLHLFGGN